MHPRPSQLKLLFQGKLGVRVRSTDGKIDCTTDCSAQYPGGSRVELRVEASPGYTGLITTCLEMQLLPSDRCFVDVRSVTTEVPLYIERTPIRRTQSAGGTNGSAVADRFGILGDLTAFGTVMNAGATFVVDGMAFPLLSPAARQGIAVFNRVKRTGWHSELPVEADAVVPTAEGGAWAVVHVSMPTAFGTTMIGTVGKLTVARLRFDATGALTGDTTILSTANGAIIMGGLLPAAFVQPDGAAAAAVVSSSGFAAQSVTEQTALAHVDAGGTARLVGLEATSSSNATMVMETGRTLVGLGPTPKLVALDASAQVTGRRAFTGGSIKSVTLRGARFGALLNNVSASSPIDLGGGARTGTTFVAEYLAPLSHVADATLPVTASALGFAFLPEGGGLLLDYQRVYRLGAGLAVVPPGDTFNLTLSANNTATMQDETGLSALLSFNTLLSFVPPP